MDERLMLEAMEKASEKHKSVFFMTDKDSSFVVVGVTAQARTMPAETPAGAIIPAGFLFVGY